MKEPRRAPKGSIGWARVLRATAELGKRIEKAAKVERLSVSEWIRAACLGRLERTPAQRWRDLNTKGAKPELVTGGHAEALPWPGRPPGFDWAGATLEQRQPMESVLQVTMYAMPKKRKAKK